VVELFARSDLLIYPSLSGPARCVAAHVTPHAGARCTNLPLEGPNPVGGFVKDQRLRLTNFEHDGFAKCAKFVCIALVRGRKRAGPRALDRILRLFSLAYKASKVLVQEASIARSEHLSMHSALQPQRATVSETVPLAWLVATFAGCTGKLESTSSVFTNVDR